jgi:hypothetical protein
MKVIAKEAAGTPFTHELPAGTYVVCDPCYVIDERMPALQEEEWDGDPDHSHTIAVEIDTPSGPAQLVTWSTLVGDGEFGFDHHHLGHGGYEPDNYSLPVDSGCLAVIDERLLTEKAVSSTAAKLVLESPMEVSIDDLANARGRDAHGDEIFSVQISEDGCDEEDDEDEEEDNDDWDDEDE